MSHPTRDSVEFPEGKDQLTLTCSSCDQVFVILSTQRSDVVECPHCGLHVRASELMGGQQCLEGACPSCEKETSIKIPDDVADQRKLLVACDHCGKDASVDAFIHKRKKLELTADSEKSKRARREAEEHRCAEQTERRKHRSHTQREARRAEQSRRHSFEDENRITPPADRELKSLIGILRFFAVASGVLAATLLFISLLGFVSLPESRVLFSCILPAVGFATYWFIFTVGAKVLSLLGSIAQGIERIDRRLESHPKDETP